MTYYKRLKDTRIDKDLTQKQIAEILQTTVPAVSDYENGKNMMGIDKYIKLAKYYQISLDYLAGIIEEERPLNENNNDQTNLTPKEIKILKAYKQNPDLQKAIDRILQI